MTVLGKLEYVEVEFLHEWMGNTVGSVRPTLKNHATELSKRKPSPIKILREIDVVNGKVVEKVESQKVEKTEKKEIKTDDPNKDNLEKLERKDLDILAKTLNLEYHHKLGDSKLAKLILDKQEELKNKPAS